MVQIKPWTLVDAESCLIQWSFFRSSVGYCLLAWVGKDICFLSLHSSKLSKGRAKLALQAQFTKAILSEQKESSDSVAVVKQYLQGLGPKLTVLVSGTPFQIKVWQVLNSIPKGTTVTYQQIAEKINSPNACRAVGSAVGANPVAVLLPCHRVLPKNAGLGGFRWGQSLKRDLLRSEGLPV